MEPFRRWQNLSFMLCAAFMIWSNSDYAPLGKNAGFLCNDTSIKKPYFGDSIHVTVLFFTLTVGPALVIYITESKTDTIDGKLPFTSLLKFYLAGFFFVLVATEVLKFSIREMRPHFYDTCRPNVDSVKCSNGLVTEYACTASGPKWLVERDVYKSFPSGHASLSFYAFVFLTLYVKDKCMCLPYYLTILWKSLVLLMFLSWSTVCCISRLLDNRHFWWDVLCGVVLGFVGAVAVAHILRRTSCHKKNV